MPYDIIWEPQGAFKKYRGELTPAEFLQSIRDLHDDPRFDQLRYTVNDFLAVTAYSAGDQDLKTFAALSIGASYTNPNIVIAVITTEARLITMVEYYRSKVPYRLQIFADEAAARAWIRQEQGLAAPS